MTFSVKKNNSWLSEHTRNNEIFKKEPENRRKVLINTIDRNDKKQNDNGTLDASR